MSDLTPAAVVNEALGASRGNRHDWMDDDLEGGLNHRPATTSGTSGETPELDDRIASIRATADRLGINPAGKRAAERNA